MDVGDQQREIKVTIVSNGSKFCCPTIYFYTQQFDYLVKFTLVNNNTVVGYNLNVDFSVILLLLMSIVLTIFH